MKKRLLSLIAGASLSFTLFAQGNFATKDHGFVHGVSKNYEWPTDPEVLKKLDQWQDLKFGIMFHWGVYSVPGISESWALCSEDKFTARRKKILREPPTVTSRNGIGDWQTLLILPSSILQNGRPS